LAAGVSVRWRLQTHFIRDGRHADVQWLQPQVRPALGQERWLAEGRLLAARLALFV